MIELVEEWRSLAPFGFPGYDVSDYGRVRSYWKQAKGSRTWQIASEPQRVRRPATRRGYLRLDLRDADHRQHTRSIHRLVLEVFRGPCPPGHEAHHRNHDAADNRLVNLEWTPKVAHRSRHQRCENNNASKLTEATVRLICSELVAGTTETAIAVQFGISQTTVSNIGTRRIWAAVSADYDLPSDPHRNHHQPRGEVNPFSKLTEATVRVIRAEVAAGASTAALARRLSVHRATIERVVARQTWAHVSDEPPDVGLPEAA